MKKEDKDKAKKAAKELIKKNEKAQAKMIKDHFKETKRKKAKVKSSGKDVTLRDNTLPKKTIKPEKTSKPIARRVNTLPKTVETTARKVATKSAAKNVGKEVAKKVGKGALGILGALWQDDAGQGAEVDKMFIERAEKSRKSKVMDKEVVKMQNKVHSIKKEAAESEKVATIQSNRPEILKAVKKTDVFTPEQRKVAIEHLKSDESLHKSKGDIDKPEEDLSAVDNFKRALTFFAPQLIGGAIGAALEGDEGAIAGYKEGGTLRDSYLDYKQQQYENKLKDDEVIAKKAKALMEAQNPKRKLQQDRDKSYRLPDGTLASVIIDLDTGEELHPITNQPLKPEEFKNLVSAEQRRIDSQKHGFEEDAQFEGKQYESQVSYNQLRGNLDEVDRLFDRKNPQTGEITGRYNDLAVMFNKNPNNYAELKVATTKLMAKFIHEMSGTASARDEVRRLMGAVPNTENGAKIFEAKLRQFRRIVVKDQRVELESIARTQPHKRALAQRELARLDREEGNSLPQHTKNQIGPQSFNDRINAMSPEKKARYEAYVAKRNKGRNND